MRISSLKVRNFVPIKNLYSVIEAKEDIHVCIYKSKGILVKARRIDRETGWDVPIQVRIGRHVIEIPVSENNVYQKIYSNINVEEEEILPQLIPKVIIQTEESDTMSVKMYNSVMTLVDMNPEYEYRFFTEKQRREFIRNFSEPDKKNEIGDFSSDLLKRCVMKAYDSLVSGAFQADLFRYCYLYMNGGCYFDAKMVCRNPLRRFIRPDDTFLICLDQEKTNTERTCSQYYNAVMFSVAGNVFLKNVIVKCVDNILNRQEYFLHSIIKFGYHDILNVTGPLMLYNVLKTLMTERNLRFKYIMPNEKEYQGRFIIDLDTHEVLCNIHTSFSKEKGQLHYSEDWISRNIFKKI